MSKTLSKHFLLSLSRPKEDSCNYQLYPIITFDATDTVLNDDIYLTNGTILSLNATKHSSQGSENFGKLKFNMPIRLGEVNLGERVSLAMIANLRKKPNAVIKTGPFSTSVIYRIEYR